MDHVVRQTNESVKTITDVLYQIDFFPTRTDGALDLVYA